MVVAISASVEANEAQTGTYLDQPLCASVLNLLLSLMFARFLS